jgi:hypothetical protein
MINETQLTVQTVTSQKILSQSNDTSYGGSGSLRIIVDYYSELSSLDSVELFNNAGQSQNIGIASIEPYVPGPTQAVINFDTILFFDFRNSNGGYYTDNVVDSSPLDLYENESIAQTWTFTDLSALETRSPFTRQFRIPNTGNNQRVFEALLNPNYSKLDNFFLYRLPAQIAVDNIPIIEGYLKLNKVISQRDLLTDYDVTFFGKTSDLARDIGAKKLKDLNVDLVTTVDFNTIESAETGALDFIFAMCDRGQQWNTASGRDFEGQIFAGDFTPALKWSYIFNKIVTEAGWTYDADELINTLDSVWMPWLNSIDIKVTTNPTINRTFQARLTNNAPIGQPIIPGGLFIGNVTMTPTTTISNPGGYWLNSTSEYLISAPGLYSFQIRVVLDVIGTGFPVTSAFNQVIEVYLDNTVTGVNTYVGQCGVTAVQNDSLGLTYLINVNNFQGYTGDKLRVRFRCPPVPGLITNPLRIVGSGVYGTLWKVTAVNLFTGLGVDWSANAPDMKQIDFVNDVIKMFNLAVVAHPSLPKRLIFKTMSEFIGSGNTYDWTNKLDLSKDVVLYSTADIQKAEMYFSYTAGSDGASKLYVNAGRSYGDLRIDGYTVNPDIEQTQFATGKLDVKLVTQSTPSQFVSASSSAIIPKFLDTNGSFIAPGPRALFFSHTVFIQQMEQNGTFGSYYAPALSHYSAMIPTVSDFDLNWAPEVPLFNVTSKPFFTLFNLYWRDYLNEIYSPDARIMEAFFTIDITDITPVDFAAKIFIKDSYWRILEISDYKYGAFESTKVKLLKIVTPIPDCDVTPVGLDTNDVVLFVDANGDPAPGNQTCCERYGYTWNSVTNECSGIQPPDILQGFITEGIYYNGINNPFQLQTKQLITGTNVNVAGNINSVTAGRTINVDENNNPTLAIGENLELIGEQRGAALLGKSVVSTTPGLHLGGGYVTDNPANTQGASQWGVIIQHSKDGLSASGDTIYLTTEGIDSKWLSLPDDTTWNVIGNLTVYDPNSDEHYTAVFNVYLEKIGGVASASAITVLNTTNNLTGLIITPGVGVFSGTHRFSVTATGTGFPYSTVQCVLSLNYTQYRK